MLGLTSWPSCARRLHHRCRAGRQSDRPAAYEQKHYYDPLKDFEPIAVSTANYLGIVANPEVRSSRSRK